MVSSNDNALIEAMAKLKRDVDAVSNLVDQLKEQLAGKEITARLAEYLAVFDVRVNDFETAYQTNAGFDRMSRCASDVKTFAEGIARSTKEDSGNSNIARLKAAITIAFGQLAASIEDREVIYNPSARGRTALPIADAGKIINTLGQSNIELKNENEEQKRAIAVNERKLAELEGRIDTITSQIREKLDQTNLLYDSALVELKKKEAEIAELVGVASGKAIAGSYENSAATEKEMADYLRYGSLVCMLVIIIFVGYSFFETTTNNFKWETSAFRLIFTIFLSIPAAYLARESTKHRLQQYSHLQTSLDLKAITPYIASLPAPHQHRLKSEIANRLFAAKNQDQIGRESYPVNIHELLVSLINKLELPSKKNNDEAKSD